MQGKETVFKINFNSLRLRQKDQISKQKIQDCLVSFSRNNHNKRARKKEIECQPRIQETVKRSTFAIFKMKTDN